MAETNGIVVKRKPFAKQKEGRGIGTLPAKINGIAVKRKPFANTKRREENWNSCGGNQWDPGKAKDICQTKRGEGTMQCTRPYKTKSDVNTAHGDECVFSAMIESMRVTSMMVMKKDDYKLPECNQWQTRK